MKTQITGRIATDGLAADALRTAHVAVVWAWEKLVEALRGPARLDRAGEATARGDAAPAAPSPIRDPATLRELGVPGSLAAEFETYFELMGATGPDGHVAAFRFRTPDGASHALRVSREGAGVRKVDRAA